MWPKFFLFLRSDRGSDIRCRLRDVLFATELARMTSKRSLSLPKKWIAYNTVHSWAVREKIVRVLYRCPSARCSISLCVSILRQGELQVILLRLIISVILFFFYAKASAPTLKRSDPINNFLLLFYYLFTFLLMSVLPIGRVASTRISYMLFRPSYLVS
jgi:hypothetical protein